MVAVNAKYFKCLKVHLKVKCHHLKKGTSMIGALSYQDHYIILSLYYI